MTFLVIYTKNSIYPTKFQIWNTLESVLLSDIVVGVPRPICRNEMLSMRVDNFSETSLWKLLSSDIPPRHSVAALVAHKCATAHRLGSTDTRTWLWLRLCHRGVL